MIEIDVIKYLSQALGVSVTGEKPTRKPTEYVVIEAIDSGRENYIDAITLSIMSYSDTLLNAAKLDARVREAMYDIVTLENVSSCKLGGGSQSIDKQTKEYAYESIFNLIYM